MASRLTIVRDLFNVISPRYCTVCGSKLVPCEKIVCSSCLIQLPYLDIKDYADNDITKLFLGIVAIEHGYSHIRYRQYSQSHQLLVKLKYGHRPDIGLILGEQIAEELKDKGFFEGIDAIVPIPLHWKRWLRRGYNQSTQLAKGISRGTGIPVCSSIVSRIKDNRSQTSQAPMERSENVQGIFRSKITKHKHLLIVDDVLTTGATITSCAKAIEKENPDIRISVLTLAKA